MGYIFEERNFQIKQGQELYHKFKRIFNLMTLKLTKYKNITPNAIKKIYKAMLYQSLQYSAEVLPWEEIKKFNSLRLEIDKLRRKISRIGFESEPSSFNEATSIDLNWLSFEAECSKKFLKYSHKLEKRCMN